MTWIGWVCLGFIVTVFGVTNYLLWKAIQRIGNRVDALIKGRETFYASLTDPDVILADMERGAYAMEALVARRRRNVREDAGPHAKIYKPKKTGELPKRSWMR